MREMAQVSPHLFQLLLACFCLVVSLTAAQESGPTAEDGPRVDAELDPYETVMFAAAAGSPTSDLFSSCLESDRTAEVKLFSIEAPGGKEFFRYVPDDELLKFEVVWSPVTDVEISSIFDCADAAAGKGSSMFKYQAGACQVSDQLYDIDYPAACEDSVSEAVFLLPGSSLCAYPAFDVSSDPTNSICAISYDTGDHIVINALEGQLCPSNEYWLYYHRTGLVDMATLRQILLNHGIGNDLLVCTFVSPTGDAFNYCDATPVNVADMIDGVVPEPISSSNRLVMSAADGFFLKKVLDDDVIGHNLCVLK